MELSLVDMREVVKGRDDVSVIDDVSRTVDTGRVEETSDVSVTGEAVAVLVGLTTDVVSVPKGEDTIVDTPLIVLMSVEITVEI